MVDDGDADARPQDPARPPAPDGPGAGARDGRGLDQADAAGPRAADLRARAGGQRRLSGMERGVLRAVAGVAGVPGEDAVLGAEGGGDVPRGEYVLEEGDAV